MNEELRRALIAMGYRRLHGGWAKPVGYNLFTFSPIVGCLENWFKSADGEKLLLYNSVKIDANGDILNQIKEFERHTKRMSLHSSFEFAGVGELLEL